MKTDYIDLISGDVRRVGPEPPKSMNTNINLTSAVILKNRLVVDFEYTVTYLPDESMIRIAGKGIFTGSEAKKAKDEWEKTTHITGSHGELILNAINYSASLNALLLARAFNMTPPVILPELKFRKA